MHQNKRVRLIPLKSPTRTSHDITNIIILSVLQTCGNGAVGEDTLEAVAVNLHTGSSGPVVILR